MVAAGISSFLRIVRDSAICERNRRIRATTSEPEASITAEIIICREKHVVVDVLNGKPQDFTGITEVPTVLINRESALSTSSSGNNERAEI